VAGVRLCDVPDERLPRVVLQLAVDPSALIDERLARLQGRHRRLLDETTHLELHVLRLPVELGLHAFERVLTRPRHVDLLLRVGQLLPLDANHARHRRRSPSPGCPPSRDDALRRRRACSHSSGASSSCPDSWSWASCRAAWPTTTRTQSPASGNVAMDERVWLVGTVGLHSPCLQFRHRRPCPWVSSELLEDLELVLFYFCSQITCA